MADAGGFEYGLPSNAAAEIAVVRAIYDAFARRDVEAALPYIDDSFEVMPSGTAGLVGRTQPYRGRDGIRQYIADAGRAWAELTLHADDIRAISGSVVVFGRVEGRPAGGDATVERRILWTWKLRDGRAVSLRVNDFGG